MAKIYTVFFPAVLPLSWSTSISFFFTVVESSLKEYDQGEKDQRDRRVALGRGVSSDEGTDTMVL